MKTLVGFVQSEKNIGETLQCEIVTYRYHHETRPVDYLHSDFFNVKYKFSEIY